METLSALEVFCCSDVNLPPQADILVVEVSSSRMKLKVAFPEVWGTAVPGSVSGSGGGGIFFSGFDWSRKEINSHSQACTYI